MIEVISATRMSERDFWAKSALGRSLLRLEQDSRLIPRITYANTRGLSEIYNARMAAATDDSILLFIHDDVWLDDERFADRIIEGLAEFDMIGLAGSRRRLPKQPSWGFVMSKRKPGIAEWDEDQYLSGAVAHGADAHGEVRVYGEAPAECELMDGVLLAARKSVLDSYKVGFDKRFMFHFYDLDVCRLARKRGMRLGTWPIAITHQSGGSFGTPMWQQGYQTYLEKWKD